MNSPKLIFYSAKRDNVKSVSIYKAAGTLGMGRDTSFLHSEDLYGESKFVDIFEGSINFNTSFLFSSSFF